ncbi:MAG: hypothetical protein E7172_02850 [Firmicutes bacterium]|nr:hypothetical protein [Bacillota bacterium]
MINVLKIAIQLILIVLLSIMLIANIININIWIIIGFLLVIAYSFLIKKNNLLNEKLVKKISLILLIIGIIIRLFLIFTLDFNLSSDFKLYYDTAYSIANNTSIIDAWYLSFNGYVVIFSSILAVVFKIFGSSIINALLFNLIIQLFSCVILKKIINLYTNNYLKYLLPSIWFILPTVSSVSILISTENLFIFMFLITIYYYLKIKDDKSLNLKNSFKYLLFGLLLSLSNNIRPIMIIFIIALIIEFILNFKDFKELGLLFIICGSFFISNLFYNKYIENVLNEPIRSGALAWSVYFGANYDTRGYWSELDAIYVGEILQKENSSNILIKESINRYQDLGIFKTILLFGYKYYHLWTDVNANFAFLSLVTSNNYINLKTLLETISFIMTFILIINAIKSIILKIKEKDFNFLTIYLFLIGYILSNLLIVVNGRYNYPRVNA